MLSATNDSNRVYRTRDVSRILGLSQDRVRSMVRAGLCNASKPSRTFEYSFGDLVLMRTARDLRSSSVSAQKLRKVMRILSRGKISGRPLSGLRIYADRGEVILQDGSAAWQILDGQGVLRFKRKDRKPSATTASLVTSLDSLRAQRDNRSQTSSHRREIASVWFDRGVNLEERGDIVGATQAYLRARELDPEMGDVSINLGRLAYEEGDSATAVVYYQEAISVSPDDSIAHYNLALALEDGEKYHAAVLHYRRALELSERFADAHFNLSQLLEKLGHRQSALRHLSIYRKLRSSR